MPCPEVSAEPPISQIGDLWLLGRHRVLCGNALDPEAIRDAERRNGPPWSSPTALPNVPIEGHASDSVAIHHRPFPMASADGQSRVHLFLGRAAGTSPRSAPADHCHYVCMDWAPPDELLPPAEKPYGEIKNVLPSGSGQTRLGSLYRQKARGVVSSSSKQAAGQKAKISQDRKIST